MNRTFATGLAYMIFDRQSCYWRFAACDLKSYWNGDTHTGTVILFAS